MPETVLRVRDLRKAYQAVVAVSELVRRGIRLTELRTHSATS